jgi:O-antigen/teichoic acid export membrane protein
VKGLIHRMHGPIARGTVLTTLVQGVRLLIQGGSLLLVARMLGPQQFGAFAGVAALAVILGTLSTFGTHLVLASEVSKEPSKRQRVLAYALPTTLLCGGLLFIAYLLICVFLLREAAVPFVVLAAIGVTEMLLQPLFGLAAWEHLALGRVARSQLLMVLPLALRLLAVVLVTALQARDPLTLYSYGYLLASAIALGAVTLAMPAAWPSLRQWRILDKSEMRNAIGFAALAISNMGSVELDKTLASKLLPLSAAGVYAAGTRIIGATMLPVLAMMLSALPRLFREAEDKSHGTARLLGWIFAAAFTYSIVLAGFLWVAAPIFVWLFGVKYEGLQHVIHLLCAVLPGLALRKAAGNVLMGMGSAWARVRFEVTGLLCLCAVAAWLTPSLGVTGMAIALMSSEWSMAVVGCAIVFASYRRLHSENH